MMSKTEEITPPVPGSSDPPRIDERYRIEKEIGRGGMGRVFVAHDRKLGREVAIKVLASGLHGEEALRRFEQEARATCALNHANILDVHDIGTHEGNPYIVSELLHGITLRERLRQGPLPVKEASGYALQLAQGLSAAHEKGIVHRDLKPENLFITEEGRLKILDFGIAKLVTSMTLGTDETLPSPQSHTQEGAILGTVGYMSPEQVRGQPADQRSDVFSFGAIVYEMLAGRSPFERDTAVETGYAILNDERPELPASVPPDLDRIVRRCLERDPDDRFQSAHELVNMLGSAGIERAPARKQVAYRWALRAGAALTLVVLAVLGWILRARSEAPGKSIAVLPFASLSAGEDNAYFAEGIHGELLNRLSQIADLKVISRTSVQQYKTGTHNLREIGEQLGVAAVLEGSVQRAGNRVRIEVQLVDARKDHQLWADRYDRDLSDIFQIQSAVAEEIANKLHARLSPSERSAIERRATQSQEAWDLYLRGEAMRISGDFGNLPGAERLFRKALEVDAGFALAIAQLSRVLNEEWFLGLVQDTLRRVESRALAERARELQPDLPEAHLALGLDLYHATRDYPAAEQEFRLALASAPGCAECIGYIGWLERRQGRWNDALASQARALELDPRNEDILATYAETLGSMRKYADALAALDRQARVSLHPEEAVESRRWIEYAMGGDIRPLLDVLATKPPGADIRGDYTASRWQIAMIERRFDDAIAVLRSTSLEMLTWALTAKADLLGQALAAAGRKADARAAFEEARAAYEKLLRVRPDDPMALMQLAWVDANLGRVEAARREAAQASALLPETKDALEGVGLSGIRVGILIVTGELDPALAETERLATVNNGFTRADLEMPTFDPLRSNPRFQKVLARLRGQ